MDDDERSAAPRTAIVVLGGVAPAPGFLTDAEAGAFVVAADSGAAHALALGLVPDVVVGDLDSIDPDLLARLERDGARIERHRVDKDETDLELAIDVAVREGVEAVLVVGSHGGRVDHSAATLMVLTAPERSGVRMSALLDGAQLSVVHGGSVLALDGAPGDVVTLLAMHGDAHGVRTTGLEYPLHGETLSAGRARGVSNVQLDAHATVSVAEGTVLVIRPGTDHP